MEQSPSVTVLDADNRFLDRTHPAMARRLLRDKQATVWNREPFTIKLNRSVQMPLTQRRGSDMDNVNFTQYFREDKDVYVQNVSDAQVSVMFDTGNGVESYLFSPSKDPINITQRFPFEIVKKSLDFRKMVSRRPQALSLLSEEEYRKYYAAKASSHNLMKVEKGKKVPDIDAAINLADAAAQRVLRKEPLEAAKPTEPIHDVEETPDGKKVARASEMVTEDIINPRIQHLCNQVKAELADHDKLPANQFLAELQQIEGNLSLDDWEYIRAHGMYKSVKNYAKRRVSEIATGEEGIAG